MTTSQTTSAPTPGSSVVYIRAASRDGAQATVDAFCDLVERKGGCATFEGPVALEDRSWAATGTVVLMGGGL